MEIPDAFWSNKANADAIYDIILMGDSRIYRGLSPEEMATILEDYRILNFGFSAGGLNLLIGVDSIWHGILVFAMSLLAILAFASVTQNWLFVRNRLWESALLAVAIVMLFRPGLFMDRIYPPFKTIAPEAYVSGEFAPQPGQIVRFHVVRETRYGDRYKLFALRTPESGPQIQGPFGLTLDRAGDGHWQVQAVVFNGPAEAAGMRFGDIVTDIDLELSGLPPKELVYPFALILLGGVVFSQSMRKRRLDAAGRGPAKSEAE
jgi:hypothetical protein